GGEPGDGPAAETAAEPGKGSARAGVVKPRWNLWAIGLEVGNKWHLFRQLGGEWRPQRLGQGISKGRQTKLLEALSEGRRFLAERDALELERRTFSPGDIDPLMSKIKPEISKLRGILRDATGATDTQADPLPYDDLRAGWQAEIQVGYAVQDPRTTDHRRV